MHRLAVISDVHGNLTAYRRVLEDVHDRGIDQIVNLGDVIGKGPRGAECLALTRQRCQVTVRGNWDDFIGRDEVELAASTQWWRDRLSGAERRWLRELPFCHDVQLSGRRIRLFHASATSEYTRVHTSHTLEEFEGMFAATQATGVGPTPTVVGYGDIHATYLQVHHGRTLFNAGSVGNPLDEPTAAYVILEGVPDGDVDDPFGLQVVRVRYDVERELREAAALSNPEQDAYEIELRQAVYRGRARRLGLLPELEATA